MWIMPEHLHGAQNIIFTLSTRHEDLVFNTAAAMLATWDIKVRQRVSSPFPYLYVYHEGLCWNTAILVLTTCQDDVFVGQIYDAELL